jgi:ferredoxin-nitrite reductase
MKTAEHLSRHLPGRKSFTTHWSGCPAGCGNHALADIGLLGKSVRFDGRLVDAVDVFIGGKTGPNARPGTKILEDVPCEDLPEVLERMIPYVSKTRQTRSSSSVAPSGAHASAAQADASV